MRNALKQKLIKLSPEVLADALLEVAGTNEVAWHKVNRLVSDHKENSSRFKNRISELTEGRGFIPWRHAAGFAEELEDLLEDIGFDQEVSEGFELICAFYRKDSDIFDTCDDSGGELGSVFRGRAVELFSHYAKRHPNREQVLKELMDLLEKNDYGARDELMTHAIEYLSESEMRNMLQVFYKQSESDSKDRGPWRWSMQSIAEQLRDGPLYEKLVRDSMNGKPNSGQLVRIAEVYFSADQVEKAQTILDAAADNESFSAHERNDLQKRIYEKTGNKHALIELLHRNLLESISVLALDELVNQAGLAKRARYLAEVMTKISDDKKWNSSSAEFLIDSENSEALDQYVKKHTAKLDEQFYGSLVNVARFLEAEEKYLSASLTYRALTTDILNRGKSKAYGYGVRYLESLTKLQGSISDWETFENHEDFLSRIRAEHRLKRSFWAQIKEI